MMTLTAEHHARRPGASAPSIDPPDWATFTHELHCPLCGYNLRGLVEPRCPECGYGFTWAEMCERDETHHPYLFEHHPERNVRAFLQTYAAGWVPWRFWQRLTARHDVEPDRLHIYYAASLLTPLLVLFSAVFLWSVVMTINQNAAVLASAKYGVKTGDPRYALINGSYYEDEMTGWGGGPVWRLVDPPWISSTFLAQVVDRIDVRQPWTLFGLAAVAILWPWITFVTLMIFRRSMRRAAVKPVHVVRCVIYSFDFVSLLAVVSLIWPPEIHYFRWNAFAGTVVGMALLVLPIGWYRLGCAYRYYLRFSQPFMTALASQLITFLLVLAWAGNVRLR